MAAITRDDRHSDEKSLRSDKMTKPKRPSEKDGKGLEAKPTAAGGHADHAGSQQEAPLVLSRKSHGGKRTRAAAGPAHGNDRPKSHPQSNWQRLRRNGQIYSRHLLSQQKIKTNLKEQEILLYWGSL